MPKKYTKEESEILTAALLQKMLGITCQRIYPRHNTDAPAQYRFTVTAPGMEPRMPPLDDKMRASGKTIPELIIEHQENQALRDWMDAMFDSNVAERKSLERTRRDPAGKVANFLDTVINRAGRVADVYLTREVHHSTRLPSITLVFGGKGFDTPSGEHPAIAQHLSDVALIWSAENNYTDYGAPDMASLRAQKMQDTQDAGVGGTNIEPQVSGAFMRALRGLFGRH